LSGVIGAIKRREEERPDMATFATVQRLARALPGAEEGTSYRTPAFRIRGKLFARLHEQEDVLVVRVDPGDREVLTRSAPAIYYVTPHYESAPFVLVRLPHIDRAELRGLLTDAWRLSAPKRLAATLGPPSRRTTA